MALLDCRQSPQLWRWGEQPVPGGAESRDPRVCKGDHLDPAVLGGRTTPGVAGLFQIVDHRCDVVTTPVSVTVRESRAYIVTAADSGKAARLGRSDRVELTPSSIAGAPTGTTVAGRARPLDRSAARALGLLRPTRAVFWSWLLYRVRGHRMTFFEITPRRDQ